MNLVMPRCLSALALRKLGAKAIASLAQDHRVAGIGLVFPLPFLISSHAWFPFFIIYLVLAVSCLLINA